MNDHTPPPPLRDAAGAREVVGAWLVVAMLLIGTAVSFTLDQMVTVADRTEWSELSPASGENNDEDEPPEREIRDLDRR
jgi:hypothetical protein